MEFFLHSFEKIILVDDVEFQFLFRRPGSGWFVSVPFVRHSGVAVVTAVSSEFLPSVHLVHDLIIRLFDCRALVAEVHQLFFEQFQFRFDHVANGLFLVVSDVTFNDLSDIAEELFAVLGLFLNSEAALSLFHRDRGSFEVGHRRHVGAPVQIELLFHLHRIVLHGVSALSQLSSSRLFILFALFFLHDEPVHVVFERFEFVFHERKGHLDGHHHTHQVPGNGQFPDFVEFVDFGWVHAGSVDFVDICTVSEFVSCDKFCGGLHAQFRVERFLKAGA